MKILFYVIEDRHCVFAYKLPIGKYLKTVICYDVIGVSDMLKKSDGIQMDSNDTLIEAISNYKG